MTKVAGASVQGFTSVQWDRVFTPKIEDFQIATAENALRSAVSRGFDNQPAVVTDNVANRDYHDVKPFGRIEFVAKQTVPECARWLMAELTRRSPVGSVGDRHPGLYKRSHVYLINGSQADDADLDRLKPGDRVQIVNTVPYAGKIEGRDAFTRWDTSKTSKKGWKKSRRTVRRKQGWKPSQMAGQSSQAPRGVYRVVLEDATRRYGRMVVIDYAAVLLSLNVKVWGQQGGSRRALQGAPRKRVLRPQVYPCFTLKTRFLFS